MASDAHGSAGAARNVTVHALAYGRVQGVGYRDYVQRHATALGLGGWVRNLPDGRSVEVHATGGRAVLEVLLRRLHEGPTMAHITRVETEWSEAEQGARGGFEIVY